MAVSCGACDGEIVLDPPCGPEGIPGARRPRGRRRRVPCRRRPGGAAGQTRPDAEDRGLGHEPRSADGLQKLDEPRRQTLPWSPQKEQTEPADASILALWDLCRARDSQNREVMNLCCLSSLRFRLFVTSAIEK